MACQTKSTPMYISLLGCLLAVVALTECHVNQGGGQNGYSQVQVQDENCYRQAKKECVNLTEKDPLGNTCFGVTLPYSLTSNEVVNENFTLKQIRNDLARWEEGLRNLPSCWKVIQPLLCSFYMPRCNGSKIDLPAYELCKISRNPCRVMAEAMKVWPDFLMCEDRNKFAPNCNKDADIRQLNFNVSSKCSYPMIPVENQFNYYDGFDGCALPCKDQFFSDYDQSSVSNFIFYSGLVVLGIETFVIGPYMIDWHSAKGYPSIVVFYMNCCFFLATIGWMLQFLLPSAKDDIVCRKDATIRKDEPGQGENLVCFFVFVLIYYFSMAALAWSMVFAYVWNILCKTVGRIRPERIDKQAVVFHTFCWLTPAVFLIISMSLSAVEGSSITGICYIDSNHRIYLTILPFGVATLVNVVLHIRGVYGLFSLLVSSSDFITARGRTEVKSSALRGSAVIVASILLAIVFMYTQIQEINLKPTWAKSQRDHLICNLNLTTVAECDPVNGPTLFFVMITISIFFFGGIVASSWACTPATCRTWRRFLTKRCRKNRRSLDQQQHYVPKHKLISQAFAKRHQSNTKGRVSLSLHSTHEDPVGLNKLLDPNRLCQDIDTEMQSHNNTDAREEISSEWAAAIPHLCNRRDAIIPPHSSNSVSCVSADDSRRPSCDSAMSENVGRHGTPYEEKKSRRRFFNMGRRRSGRLWGGSSWRRGNGGSSSSLESNAGSQILPAITALIEKRRRTEEDAPLNNAPLTGPTSRRPIIMKELAVQTSMEKLNFPKNTKACNLSNNLTVDISTQCGRSLLNLHDAGTQTKKSATKKGEKSKKDKSNAKTDKGKEDKNDKEEQEDPVLKLLTPS